MFYVKETGSSLDEVIKRLRQEATAYQFVILGEHNLKEKLQTQDAAASSECRVIDILYPPLAKNMAQSDSSFISLFICHISICQVSEKVRVSTLMLKPILDAIGKPDLRTTVETTEIALKRIIDFACGPIPRSEKILDWNMA